VIDYLLAFYLYVVGVPKNAVGTVIATSLILTIIALITGLVAHFGSGKDNFGTPGIVSIIVVPLVLLAS
jgi:Na+/melibiose symporter-like transporter